MSTMTRAVRVRTVAMGFRMMVRTKHVWCAVLLAQLACGPSQSGGTVRPSLDDGAAPADIEPRGRQQGDTLGDLRQRLQELGREHEALYSAAERDTQSCERLCSLSTSICEVKEKICELADAHATEDEYQALCREAKLECGQAQSSCQVCVESHAR